MRRAVRAHGRRSGGGRGADGEAGERGIGEREHARVYPNARSGGGGRKQDERARWSYNPVQPPEFTAAPPPAFVFASADSVVLAFAPALLARRRRLVRFGCRLVGIVVEFDRAIGHQHLAVGVFEGALVNDGAGLPAR